jgi:hypothetical protein
MPSLVAALLDDLAAPHAREALRRALEPEEAPRPPNERTVFTAETLAAELGITPRAVRAAITRGDLAAIKRAGRWIIARQAVEAWARPTGAAAAARAPRRRAGRRSGRPMTDALAALDDGA